MTREGPPLKRMSLTHGIMTIGIEGRENDCNGMSGWARVPAIFFHRGPWLQNLFSHTTTCVFSSESSVLLLRGVAHMSSIRKKSEPSVAESLLLLTHREFFDILFSCVREKP